MAAVSIKTTLCAENTCGLKIENTTGFTNSYPTSGFLIPGSDVASAAKEYFIEDVFLYTYLIKNNHDGTFTNIPIPGNDGIGTLAYDQDKTFAEIMDEAGVTQHVLFKEDGYYSVYQFAVPKEAVAITQGAVQAVAEYTYYAKPDGEIRVRFTNDQDSGVDVVDTLTSCTTDWANNNIIMLRSNLVSKCFLEWCFNAVLEVFSKYYTDPLCVKDNNALKSIREKRDLLFAITNTIQYYVELSQYYQAATLIYDVSFCNICKDFINENPTLNCNCG